MLLDIGRKWHSHILATPSWGRQEAEGHKLWPLVHTRWMLSQGQWLSRLLQSRRKEEGCWQAPPIPHGKARWAGAGSLQVFPVYVWGGRRKKKKFGEEKLSLLSRRGRSADGLGGHGNQNKTTAGCRVLSDGVHCLRKCFLLLFVISESLTMFWYCLCKIIG